MQQEPKLESVNLWSDRLLVEALDEESSTKGGIIIPQTSEESGQKMRVVSMNKGALQRNPEIPHSGVRVGDIAIVSKHAGFDVKIGGRELKAVRSTDIILSYADDR